VEALAAELGARPAEVALAWLLAQGDDIAPGIIERPGNPFLHEAANRGWHWPSPSRSSDAHTYI
jgi:hypothetical protein